MDEVVLCAKDRVGFDNLLTQDTLFLFGFYYVKKELFCVYMISFEILSSNQKFSFQDSITQASG